LSARTQERLVEAASQLARHVKNDFNDIDLCRLAFTLQTGREAFEHRLAVVSATAEELSADLRAFTGGQSTSGTMVSGTAGSAETAQLISGSEGVDFLRALFRNQKLLHLARLWVAGITLDWETLYSGPRPQRISAPSYPFARERYWFTDLLPKSTTIVPPTAN